MPPASRRLVIIGLNYFQGEQDTYGHVAGDGVLVKVGWRQSAALSSEATLARLVGDEFALIAAADLSG